MIYGKCAGCRKNKLFVKERSYVLPTISSDPITSKGNLCKNCFNLIKKATL